MRLTWIYIKSLLLSFTWRKKSVGKTRRLLNNVLMILTCIPGGPALPFDPGLPAIP